jgi:diaminopimelate epimerase
MEFVKMHGLGNDFVMVDCISQQGLENVVAAQARFLCDRHFGVGADGVILVLPSEKADARMRIFNPDGSEAEMCGNGIRCFAKLLHDRGLVDKRSLTVETMAGIVKPSLRVERGIVREVLVDMGPPRLAREEIPMTGTNGKVIGETLETKEGPVKVTCLSMGNPHCVVFVPRVEDYQVGKLGPLLENHPVFPQRSNVEFVSPDGEGKLKVRVWERGAGETLACGTGACAAVVAGVLNSLTPRQVHVSLLGGQLSVYWREDNRVLLTGPAEYLFDGEINL